MTAIRSRVDLKPYNTFGIAAWAKHFCELNNIADLQALRRTSAFQNERILILGGGSNVLFVSDFDGLVIKNNLTGIQVQPQPNEKVLVKAAAGEVWHHLVLRTLELGLGGLENLSLIPGCVGASPMQNIGAYGVEIKDVFESLEALSMETGELRTFSKQECEFGYRESVFKRKLKDKYLITSVSFKLTSNPTINTSYGAINDELRQMGVSHPGIRDVSNAVIHIRQSKLPDPAVTGNAGSFFKNPTVPVQKYEALKGQFPQIVAYPAPGGEMKLAAGWLIEQCGLKGRKHLGAAVHTRQALVLVNIDNAKGRDVLELSEIVMQAVKEKFGVDLEREVNIIA